MLTPEELANVRRALFMLRSNAFDRVDAESAVAELTKHLPANRATYLLIFDALAKHFDSLPQRSPSSGGNGDQAWPSWKLN